MSEQIKRAIECLEPSRDNYDDWLYSHVFTSGRAFYDVIQTSLVALQEQLDRQENRALTINVNIQDTDFFKDLVEELAKLNNAEVEQAISRVLEKHKPTEGVGR